MKKKFLISLTFIIIIFLLYIKFGYTTEDLSSSTFNISQMEIPENVKIVGLGESIHGGKEFQTIKKGVFQQIKKKLDVMYLQWKFLFQME